MPPALCVCLTNSGLDCLLFCTQVVLVFIHLYFMDKIICFYSPVHPIIVLHFSIKLCCFTFSSQPLLLWAGIHNTHYYLLFISAIYITHFQALKKASQGDLQIIIHYCPQRDSHCIAWSAILNLHVLPIYTSLYTLMSTEHTGLGGSI